MMNMRTSFTSPPHLEVISTKQQNSQVKSRC